jgi:hypothetical protein
MYVPWYLSGGAEKYHEISVRIVSIPTEIRIVYFPQYMAIIVTI